MNKSLCPVDVPLDTVHKEWKEHYGKHHLQNIGLHSHIYQDVFGKKFYPQGFMNICYSTPDCSYSVEQGNLLPAKYASVEPAVALPEELSWRSGYATLVLSDPDGHLTDGSKELLHWMMYGSNSYTCTVNECSTYAFMNTA